MTNATPNRSLRVFLCHASADKPTVRELYQRLRSDGYAPWLDEEDLVAGQDRHTEIPKAVRASDAMIVCLSRNSIDNEGHVQKEIEVALDVADEEPDDTIFIIPLKLEDCDVPERLGQRHWVDFFSSLGYERLVRALQFRITSLGLGISQIPPSDAASPESHTDSAALETHYAVESHIQPDPPPSVVVSDQTRRETPSNAASNVAENAAPVPTSRSGEAVPQVASTELLIPRIIDFQQPWKCPAVESIFDKGDYGALNIDDLRWKAYIIEQTLRAFDVKAKVAEVNRGPAITQFGVVPEVVQRGRKVTRVKINKITALTDDLALALAAKNIRVEASDQGKDMVVIEVPNHEIARVALRDVIESTPFQNVKHTGALPIALGLDVSGQAIAIDLASLPHLLIAGTTGSGKSVCVNAIISCLIAHFTPAELRLLLVDPRRVELTNYNDVPHLLAPVVVALDKVDAVLRWVTHEMDERYRKMAQSGSRSIDVYNAKIIESKAKKGRTLEPILPYLVVVIDDLTNPMMQAYGGAKIEKTVCHLAQMARAAGIHLVIAAQPTAGVVTRSIKANFPVRIALSVASAIDSRLILDKTGAEKLRGRGDMLYVSPESESPQRLQGCFVSDKEIQNLVRYWKSHEAEQTRANFADEDELLQRATGVVRIEKRASISMLQRQLRIGYSRAARLIDRMEEEGIVGPAKADSRWREVLGDNHSAGNDD
jgi:DNA segregation ATPase FtsK/SpoIIIE, S-DNA-T family